MIIANSDLIFAAIHEYRKYDYDYAHTREYRKYLRIFRTFFEKNTKKIAQILDFYNFCCVIFAKIAIFAIFAVFANTTDIRGAIFAATITHYSERIRE